MTYLSPRRLHNINTMQDPRCPRCQYMEADFIHMVWRCPTIEDYWTGVVEQLSRVTGGRLY